MARTADRAASDGLTSREVGRQLRQIRRKQGLSRSEVARSAGLTRRELASYERGRTQVPESDLWCLAGSCGVDVGELLPNRAPVTVSSDLSLLAVGDSIRYLRNPVDDDELLREYLAMIYELRNLPPGSRVPLRERDLMSLADALGGSPEKIEERLVDLIGLSHQEASRLRAMIIPPRPLPPPSDATANPYEHLPTTEAMPPPRPEDDAVVDFFSVPRAPDMFEPPPAPGPPRPAPPTWDDAYDARPIAPPDPFGAPPSPGFAPEPPPVARPVEPVAFLEEPAPPSTPWTPPPEAIVVDHAYDSPESIVVDHAPEVDTWSIEPPPPAPPEMYLTEPVPPAAPPIERYVEAPPAPPIERYVEDPPPPAPPIERYVEEPAPAAPPIERYVEEPAPAAPPIERYVEDPPSGIASAPIVEQLHEDVLPRRQPSHDVVPAPDPSPVPDPGLVAESVREVERVASIAWVAVDEPEPDQMARGADTPRFERAGSNWRIGGIFPATAAADDGALALRRADARWALADIDAPGDFTIEASVDFSAGPGFGVLFRASVDTSDRVTGYSFDVDPIAGGGGFLVRQWEDNRQHWRPLAQSPVTDATRLLGRHNMSVTLRADQLTALIDDETVLTVPALTRCSVELGRPPCRGDRVGIQAWATTEVTIDSFRVARY